MPTAPRQTLPVGDWPFVDIATGRLTLSAYQFLARLQAGSSGSIRNLSVIAEALGVPVAEIPADGAVSVILPASFPPPPPLPAGREERLAAMPAGVPRPVAPAMPVLPVGPARPVDVLVLHHGARVMDGFGAPAGRVAGWVGDIFLQRDGGPAGAVWAKQSGAGTATGWAALGQAAGVGGVLPLVNGNMAPVGMLSDPAGQTIGVPI
ncbi:hypothetical protein [Gluconacetobacter takamatsuzukensis]|uniref:Uncharacterized protein n=1 Tax=Gluconacetobacter takamatsuzukensis TaxID=1286190 RepID=A0A7W4KET3_9PROT|nr:hypothetical protein [Gluconacetobacter takamatsuzukensis]MBB2205618.1 hypothetical protein [Gluconacetobacter takamatsuzukensis]